jgi:spore coat protein SA
MKILMISTENMSVPPVRVGAIQTYIAGSVPHSRKLHDITLLGIRDPSLPEQEIIEGIQLSPSLAKFLNSILKVWLSM